MINELDDDSEDKKNVKDGIDNAVDNHDDTIKEIRDLVDAIIGSISQVMVESMNVEQLGNRSSNTLGMRVKDSLILKVQQSQKKATPFASQLMFKLQQISCCEDENDRFLSTPVLSSECEIFSTRRKKSVSLADEVEVFNGLENQNFDKNEAGIISRNERGESELKFCVFLSENNELEYKTESDASLASVKKKIFDLEEEGNDGKCNEENFFGNTVSSIENLKTDREEDFHPSERRLTSLNSFANFESSVEMLEKNFTPIFSKENIEDIRNSEKRINSEDFFSRILNFKGEIEVDHNLSIESLIEEIESKLSLTEIIKEEKDKIEKSSTEIEERIQKLSFDEIRNEEMKEVEKKFDITSLEYYKNLRENNSKKEISEIVMVNLDLNLNDDNSKEILKNELETGSKNSMVINELVNDNEGSSFNKNVGKFSEDRDDRGVFKFLNKNFTTAIFEGESLVKFTTASLGQKDADCGKNDTWKYATTVSRDSGEFESSDRDNLEEENNDFNNFDDHIKTEEGKPVDRNETATPESVETDFKKVSSFFSEIVNSKRGDNHFSKEEIEDERKENCLGKFSDLILNVVTIVPLDNGSSDPTDGDPCFEKTLAKVSRSRKKFLNDEKLERENIGCSKFVESCRNSVISSLITDSNRDIKSFSVIANEEMVSSNKNEIVEIIENKKSCSMLTESDKNKEIKSFEYCEKKNEAHFVGLKNIDRKIREKRMTDSAKNFANSLSRIFSNSSRKRNLAKGSNSCLNSEELIRVPFKSSDDSSSVQKIVKRNLNSEIAEENGEELVAVKSLDSVNNEDIKLIDKRSVYSRIEDKSSEKRRKVSSGKSFAGIRKFFSKVSMRSGQGTEEETGPDIKDREIRRGEDGKDKSSKVKESTRVLNDDLEKSSGAYCVVMNKIERNNEQQVKIYQVESSEVRSADSGIIGLDKDEKNPPAHTMQIKTGRIKSVGETESAFSRKLKRLFKKRGSGAESIASKHETTPVLSNNFVADLVGSRITRGSSLQDERPGVHDVVTFYTRNSDQNDNENHLERRDSKSAIPLLGNDLIKKRSDSLTKAFHESRITSTKNEEEDVIESSSSAVPTSSIRNTFSTDFLTQLQNNPQDFELPFERRRSIIVMMATPDPPRREIQPEASSTSNHQQSDAASSSPTAFYYLLGPTLDDALLDVRAVFRKLIDKISGRSK